ncbi:hypothetical protein AVEN_135127-1 [Araneus ventricosus]|uniref:Uncharacterized protein n=1 Tax=Araneus ventricosus TaxID=182803 RepID=A0A4Y2HHD9_ARAVE|nr:hypothetical protein AVEN_135127-1 [Araneus ventricosus]
MPTSNGGRGGLVVKYRLRGRRAPGSKPDSTEDSPCGACCTPNHTYWPNVLQLVWCVAALFERGRQLKCRPPHLTTAQNYEVGPKIALVLFQNWTLI